MNFYVLTAIVIICRCTSVYSVTTELREDRFYIDGRVKLVSGLGTGDDGWIHSIRITVDDGQHIGIPKPDGRFRINGLPAGSHVVEVAHPTYLFDPIRVDINSEGKRRARRVNRVQLSEVQSLPYPLRFIAKRRTPYFQQRSNWTLTEVMSNPTTTSMLLPMLSLIPLLVLLKFGLPQQQDADMAQMRRADDQAQPGRPKNDNGSWLQWSSLNNAPVPDFSEMLMKWLGDWPEDQQETDPGIPGKPQKKARRKKLKNARR